MRFLAWGTAPFWGVQIKLVYAPILPRSGVVGYGLGEDVGLKFGMVR